MDTHANSLRDHLWRFVRGDEPTRAFEHWAYAESSLEARLGGEFYFDLISTNFRDEEAVRSIRKRLADFARTLPGPACVCIRLRDLDRVALGYFEAPAPAFESGREWRGEDVLDKLERFRDRGESMWWNWAARCAECGQAWLMGSEECNDDQYMRRLRAIEVQDIEQDRWPDDFETCEALLEYGRETGRGAKRLDPLRSSLGDTMADLARGKPGIHVRELAGLLDLDIDTAIELARRAQAKSNVSIAFEVESSH